MTTISEARADAAAAYDTDAYKPDRFNAPGFIIQPGTPYFEDGDTFGTWRIRFEVCYLAANGVNAVTAAALDEALDDAITRAHAAGWDVESGGEPEPLEANAVSYNGFRLSITKVFDL